MNRASLGILTLLLLLPALLRAQAPVDSVAPAAGSFYFVPDSLKADVEKVLSGRGVVEDRQEVDFNEKVILANGDTVPMYFKERNLGRFDRGLYNHLFIPKGEWVFGLTASYGSVSSSDLELLDLVTDLDLSGSTFSIKPSVAYAIRSNMTVGVRFGYSSNNMHLGALNVDFDENLNFAVADARYNQESYTAAVTFRQYIGLARRGMFGVFNDVELAFSSSHGEFTRNYAEQPKTTYTTGMDAKLSFSPGVCVKIMKNVSFNISFAVVGFYLHNSKQTEEGVETGNRFTSGANFRFNIFNINFGLGVHI